MKFIYVLEKKIGNEKIDGVGIELDDNRFCVVWKGLIESIVNYKSIDDLLKISNGTVNFKGQFTVNFLKGILIRLDKNNGSLD